MKIALGADHGGFDIKETVRENLKRRGIETEDLGCYDKVSVDYPGYAREVALRVAGRSVDQGVLVCTTGIGMSIAANRFPGVRAALCGSPEMAATARTHNNANVLVLAGGSLTPEEAESILEAWLGNDFSEAPRHRRRLDQIECFEHRSGADTTPCDGG
jgi:ribose 5-phosphate isomerase B